MDLMEIATYMDAVDALLAIRVIRDRRVACERRRRKMWVRRIFCDRQLFGAFHRLMPTMRTYDQQYFKRFLWIPPRLFDTLLHKVHPILKSPGSNLRPTILSAQRLAMTLHYLAHGGTIRRLEYQFLASECTMGKAISVVCDAIFAVLKDEQLKAPNDKASWLEVAKGFQDRWQLPNCLGAFDGKHVHMIKPANSGSTYYNYKQGFSVMLMALVDASMKFLWVDIGCNGRVSDGGVYNGSTIQHPLERRSECFPDPVPLPGATRPTRFYIAADDAFALDTTLMKPYTHRDLTHTERIFNYRISRGRRVVENAFGILAACYRLLLERIALAPHKIVKIVLATIVLHNWLRDELGAQNVDREDRNHRVVRGQWRRVGELDAAQITRGRNALTAAKNMRNYLAEYFQSEPGRVSWQDEMLT